MTQKAFLFDLDGVIVRINPTKIELENLRRELINLCAVNNILLDHKGIFNIYKKIIEAKGFNDNTAIKARDILDRYEVKWGRRCATPIKETLEFIKKLPSKDVIGIITNNGSKCIDTLIERGILPNIFQITVTRDECEDIKPSQVPILKFFSKVNKDFEEVTYYGDSDADRKSVLLYNRRFNKKLRYVDVSELNI